MTPNPKIKFAPTGLLAVDPSAYGQEFEAHSPNTVQVRDGVLRVNESIAVINIRGPISYDDPQCITYFDILREAEAAFASDVTSVVLRISSPGGVVYGAFDCARAIRAMAKASGKKLIAWTETAIASAAYAIASAADSIWLADSAQMGSIGVIGVYPNISKADAMMGIQYTILASGDRKSDGNPHIPMSDAALASMQGRVDAEAEIFFALCAAHRGADADHFRGLQAEVFIGQTAVDAKLADKVGSWSALMAALATKPESPPILEGTAPEMAAHEDSSPMTLKAEDQKEDKKEDATRAALVTASTSDDPDKASRAKRALLAYDSEEDEKKKDEEARASATAGLAAQVQTLGTQVATLTASLTSEREARVKAEADKKAADEKTAFFATRKDLRPELVASIQHLPLDTIKGIVKEITPPNALANAEGAAQGATQAGASALQQGIPTALSPHASLLDEKFGLQKQGPAVSYNPVTREMVFSAAGEVK